MIPIGWRLELLELVFFGVCSFALIAVEEFLLRRKRRRDAADFDRWMPAHGFVDDRLLGLEADTFDRAIRGVE